MSLLVTGVHAGVQKRHYMKNGQCIPNRLDLCEEGWRRDNHLDFKPVKDGKHEVLRVGFEPIWYSIHSETSIPEHCVIDDETDKPRRVKVVSERWGTHESARDFASGLTTENVLCTSPDSTLAPAKLNFVFEGTLAFV